MRTRIARSGRWPRGGRRWSTLLKPSRTLAISTRPSIINRAPLAVAVGSEGVAPVLSRHVRARIEALLAPAFGDLSGLAVAAPRTGGAGVPSGVRAPSLLGSLLLRPGGPEGVRRPDRRRRGRGRSYARDRAQPSRGHVSLVGAGPGAEDLPRSAPSRREQHDGADIPRRRQARRTGPEARRDGDSAGAASWRGGDFAAGKGGRCRKSRRAPLPSVSRRRGAGAARDGVGMVQPRVGGFTPATRRLRSRPCRRADADYFTLRLQPARRGKIGQPAMGRPASQSGGDRVAPARALHAMFRPAAYLSRDGKSPTRGVMPWRRLAPSSRAAPPVLPVSRHAASQRPVGLDAGDRPVKAAPDAGRRRHHRRSSVYP